MLFRDELLIPDSPIHFIPSHEVVGVSGDEAGRLREYGVLRWEERGSVLAIQLGLLLRSWLADSCHVSCNRVESVTHSLSQL